MTVSRRAFLTGISAIGANAALQNQVFAYSGAINANSEGLKAGSPENQGARLQKILNKASENRKPVFLEPGQYRISDITLPKYTSLQGLAGSTRIEYAGGNHFIFCEQADRVKLSGIDFDGILMPTAKYADAALHLNAIRNLTISECSVTNAAGSGMHVLSSTGKITGNRIESAVGAAGFIGHDNNGLNISDNLVEDCANGGILIHRWSRGADNTIVSRNRIRRIASVYGGTGQWGNGINTYLADGVIVSDNHVSDCAFSTIRSNSCSNIQISDNTCLRAGETSVYSEFAFDGAKITGNVIDGGATGVSFANFIEGGRMGVCANNLIRNIHDHLPYKADGHIHGNGIYAEADTSIVGNVIENTKNSGVMLGWGPYLRNIIASSNMIRKTKTGFFVSVVEGIGSVTISDNILAKIESHGIAGYQWHDRVTADLIAGGSAKFPTLKIARNVLDS